VEGLVVTWRELLVVVVAVLAVYAAELVLLVRWSGRTRRWARERGTSAEQRLINSLSLEIGELRKQTAQLQAEIEKLKSANLKPVSPYNHAIQMAREGRSAAEVASGCGISRGEAELIVALYRKLRI
jgi:type II secretory pathway pseudopilin PulG